MYEHRREPLLPLRAFLKRAMVHVAAGIGIVLASLLVGMWGYRHFEHLSWEDAFLNAAMLLGGMGPVDPPQTAGGKLFAGAYALYAGIIFLVAVGVMLAPLIHRVLHRFHLADEATERRSRRP